MSMKVKIQASGRFLSTMIMPNIGAFIAWGLLTALFIPSGWIPNAGFAQLVDPMIKYLLPLLIGYQGGKMTGGDRGAVTGAITTIGVITGSDIPMFMGAMICGPLGGLAIRLFDRYTKDKIASGFEMLVNNFSVGIIGLILALISFMVIQPATLLLTKLLSLGVEFFVRHGLLPFVAFFVEPAKILFLNNAINHGIFTPMGIEQSMQTGKSLFFMIESNPGPGLGLLLAYYVAGNRETKASIPGAVIIQFLGGIHEIYFPYVLMNPVVIIGPMLGNFAAILILQLFGGGLIAAASPGSIFAQLIMSPRGSLLVNLIAITVSAGVSFIFAAVLLRVFSKNSNVSLAKASEVSRQQKNPSAEPVWTAVSKIVFACDAGMGSSAMGAALLRKKLKASAMDHIEVSHTAVDNIPSDAQIVVTHFSLTERAKTAGSNAYIMAISNFMAAKEYDGLIEKLKK